MSRTSIACLGLLALIPACFDPSAPARDDSAGTTDASESSAAATVGSPTSGGDPSSNSSSDPSADPSADPSSDPTSDSSADTTTAESSDGPTSAPTSDTDDPTDDPSSATGESSSDASSSSDAESSSDSGDPSCPGQCAPQVPGGWQGPVVINEGDDADPCPAGFPQLVHGDQHAELSPGNASCDCECGNVVGASCGSVTIQQTNQACTINQGGSDVLPPNTCTFISNGAGTYAISQPSLQVLGASCQPQANESIPDPSWGRDVRSCSAAVGDACDGGNCLPSTPDEHLMCIWSVGEAACPDGPWTQQVITYGDVDDDRDCTACSCGAPSGTCGGNIELNNQDCGAFFIADATPGTCGLQPAASHATYVPQVNASCTPSGGALVGGVEPTDAITYCCL